MIKRPINPNNLSVSVKKRKMDKNCQALHDACDDFKTPMNIIQDIYNVCPDAALIQIDGKYTPISIAVESEFADAVHFLANACPEACSIRNDLGSTPLLSATYKINRSNIIDSIIIANPRAAFVGDNDGDSAFDTFFRIWNVFIRIAVCNQSLNDKELDTFIGHGNWTIRDVYKKTCLFLKAANLCDGRKSFDDNCSLHCAFRKDSCHWAFCKLLMRLHPEQILARDADGNLPIHVILAAKNTSDEESFLCYDCY